MAILKRWVAILLGVVAIYVGQRVASRITARVETTRTHTETYTNFACILKHNTCVLLYSPRRGRPVCTRNKIIIQITQRREQTSFCPLLSFVRSPPKYIHKTFIIFNIVCLGYVIASVSFSAAIIARKSPA